MNPVVKDFITCPTCLQKDFAAIELGGKEALACRSCGGVFPVNHGAPHLIDIRAMLEMDQNYLGNWHISQFNALPYYEAGDKGSLATLDRSDVQQFIDLVDVKGQTILDLGSGTDPAYLGPMKASVAIGLEPMELTEPSDWPIVGGFAEMLPFEDETFDTVLSVTSLDHVFDLSASLREVYRVLKPHGQFVLWTEFTTDPKLLGSKLRHRVLSRSAPPEPLDPERAAEHYVEHQHELTRRLAAFEANPERYSNLLVDKFHFRHFARDVLQEEIFRAGLVCKREEPIWSTSGAYNDLHIYQKVDACPTRLDGQKLYPSYNLPVRAETLVAAAIRRGIEIFVQSGILVRASGKDADQTAFKRTLQQAAVTVLQEIHLAKSGKRTSPFTKLRNKLGKIF